MRLFTATKTFTIVAALLASGTSLAMAQNGDLAASSISGDLVLVRTPVVRLRMQEPRLR